MTADMLALDPMNLAAIIGMAVVTLALRFAGFAMVRRITPRGRLAAALESVPPAVLTSLVAPMAFATGPAEALAALATVLAAWRLPVIAAAGVGVVAVVGLRLVLG